MRISKRQQVINEMLEAAKEQAAYERQLAADAATAEYYAATELTGLEEHLRDSQVSSAAEWDRFDAELAGERRTTQAWICSDRDVWYRNPYYTGPAVPHPEEER